MTAVLEGGEWSAARPGHTLPPGKTRYPFYRRLGGPQGQSGWVENLFHTGIRSRTVQPVVSRYADWATRPTLSTVPPQIYWDCTLIMPWLLPSKPVPIRLQPYHQYYTLWDKINHKTNNITLTWWLQNSKLSKCCIHQIYLTRQPTMQCFTLQTFK